VPRGGVESVSLRLRRDVASIANGPEEGAWGRESCEKVTLGPRVGRPRPAWFNRPRR
jgi:hypothetical protein